MRRETSLPDSRNPAIYVEQAEIVANVQRPAGQFVLVLRTPKTAATALPGQFVHVQVSDARPLRRPISIMLVHPENGTIDLLVKATGAGTHELKARKAGESISILGPIGRPFNLEDTSRRYVCIGGGVGIPPMIFAADRLAGRADVTVFAGSEIEFPFALRPSGFVLPGIGGNAILAVTSLEERGIPSRLASNADIYGCYPGHVTEMARNYLLALNEEERRRCVLLACGPHTMLAAVARLSHETGIPAQLSLEEYMACGVGGCAGCVVKTVEDGQEHYRRVCVDGPVFDAAVLPAFFTP